MGSRGKVLVQIVSQPLSALAFKCTVYTPTKNVACGTTRTCTEIVNLLQFDSNDWHPNFISL